jgi:hypothetical protein
VDVVGVHEGVDGAVVGEAGSGVRDVVRVCGGDCLGGGAVAGEGWCQSRLCLHLVEHWGDKHGLCEVLLQSKVKVSDLELLG